MDPTVRSRKATQARESMLAFGLVPMADVVRKELRRLGGRATQRSDL